MATQKEIREWLPPATAIFQKYMPLDRMPQVFIASERSVLKKRAEIVERLRSPQKNVGERYDAMMEMIHGKLGDAILIRQDLLPSTSRNPNAENAFRRMFWHELGHYLAIKSEKTDLHRFNDPGLADERAKQEGYWLWSEFVAEAIALRVDEMHCRIDNSAYYHPELLTWHPKEWSPVVENLQHLLEMSFNSYEYTIDENALGIYFATYLFDDATKRYVQAGKEGKLKRYARNGESIETIPPGSIDTTCFDEYEEAYSDALNMMLSQLMKQSKKDCFWEIDEAFLEELGHGVIDLMSEKIALLAANAEN